MAWIAASRGLLPSVDMMRSTFSSTTMASSTTMPIASTSPNRVSRLMEKPSRYMPAKVPMIDTGMAMTGMIIARTLCRNRKTTSTTSDDRLDEGDDHLLDRHLDEARGVERHVVAQPLGEALGDALHRLVDRLGHLQRVGAGLQVDADRHGGRAVEDRREAVGQRAQLDPRHVLQAQRPADLVGADDDVLELGGIDQPRRRRHRIGEDLRVLHRLLAEAAGGELRVLLAHHLRDVARRQIVLRELVGPEPDAHRIVRGAEQGGVADARQAAQLVDHVHQRVVADEAPCRSAGRATTWSSPSGSRSSASAPRRPGARPPPAAAAARAARDC